MRLFEGTEFDVPPRCERCEELEEDCCCIPEPTPLIPPADQTATLSIEKRKKGKMVTIVRGLPAVGNNLPSLLGKLKSTCGAGGTIKDGIIEVQGDHLERIRAVLDEMGFRTSTVSNRN